MSEARYQYRIDQLDIESINAVFSFLVDRFDEIEGRRGTPSFYADIDMLSNQINNLADAVSAQDALPFGQLVSLGTNLIPDTDDTYDLGSTTYGWQDLYLTGTLYFDDTNAFTHDGTDFTLNDSLKVGNLLLNSGSITDSGGTIDFGDENLDTTGTVTGINITSGVDPGHTHSSSSITEADPLSVHKDGTVALTGDWDVGDFDITLKDFTMDGYFSMQTAVDSTTAFQILDADGGVPIFNVDTTNERIGIGTNAPDSPLHVLSALNTAIRVETSASNKNAQVHLSNSGIPQIWSMRNEATSGKFVFIDTTGPTNVFTLESGAPTDSFYVNSSGYVGINENTPTVPLTVTGNGLFKTTSQLQFGDSGTYIAQLTDGHLDLTADVSIDLNAPDIDLSNQAIDILIKDAEATALLIKEGANNYMIFDTTNSAEQIEFAKDFVYEDTNGTILHGFQVT